MSEKKTCYAIGNTHIDHTWVWNWTEGFDEVYASWQAALDRMDEFPEFVFTCSSTLLYRWVEDNDPALFARIKEKVAEGRWQIAGGWVVQSDNNIPTGEAFVRQGLYGQRWFRSRFGVQARTGYCVDSFGHHAQLPQILRGQGMTGWLHFRPSPHEMVLPDGPYRWRGIDGSEVVACRPHGWYCTPDEKWFENTSKRILGQFGDGYAEALFFYGVGDHGGGPTIRDLNWMREFRTNHPDVELVYGELDRFYANAESAELPLVEGELQHSFRGCYTTNAALKTLNRRAEGRLLSAETIASLATLARGARYPKAEIDRAWDQTLVNHFHDIICGTCSPSPADETLFRYGAVLETAERVRHPSAKHLVSVFERRPPAPFAESLALALVNPNSWDRTEPVEFFAHLPGRTIANPIVVDPQGNPVPMQKVEPPFGTPGPQCLLFQPTIPAGGAALFHVVEGGAPEATPTDDTAEPEADTQSSEPDPALHADALGLENEFWKVGIGTDGRIVSLQNKPLERELLRPEAPFELRVVQDLSDSWGTDRKGFFHRLGAFAWKPARVLENGPLRAKVELRGSWEQSTARLVLSLMRGSDALGFEVEIHWNAAHQTLKASFPLALQEARSFYEIPYGTLERPVDGGEEPLQKWLRVDGDSEGVPTSVGLVLDTVGGADVSSARGGVDINLTLLRSPYFGYLTGADSVLGLERPHNDQGVHRTRFDLVAGQAGTDLGLPERGVARNQPLAMVFEGSRPGTTREPFSLLRCTPSTVHATSLKGAEDGDGWIVRLVETRGIAQNARVDGPPGCEPIETHLEPFEIQSWKWNVGGAPSRVDLLEDPLA